MPASRLIFGVLPWYSALIVTGMVLAILLGTHEVKRLGLPKDTMIDLALRVIPIGIIGARIYYVVFSWSSYADDPLRALYIWEGGLAIYGGVIAGGITAVVFALRRKLNPLTLLDILVPGVILAQAIGRWGNFFNMEAYGAEITDPAWQFFPFGVLIPENGENVWHLATFFYESMWNLIVFGILWGTRKRMRRPGDTFLWYVLLYGAGRLVIEGLRLDSLMSLSGALRVSQILSLCACIAVPLVFLCLNTRGALRIASLVSLVFCEAAALFLSRQIRFAVYVALFVILFVLVLRWVGRYTMDTRRELRLALYVALLVFDVWFLSRNKTGLARDTILLAFAGTFLSLAGLFAYNVREPAEEAGSAAKPAQPAESNESSAAST